MRRSVLVTAAVLLVPAVALAGFRVSGFKKENKLGSDYWNAASALDGKLDTCWMVDPESENKGEWFEVDIPKATVDKLSMVVGWDKDEKTFGDYPRIKSARVEIFGNDKDANAKIGEENVNFEDKRGWQTVDLKDTAVGSDMNGGRVRITVTDIYPGKDFPNLAVSEVLVRLKETDVASAVIKIRQPPDSEQPNHDATKMFDGDAKSFYAAVGGETTFGILADGFGVSTIGFQQGPQSNARPKTIEISTANATETVTLADKPDVQWFDLPGSVGYSGSAWGTITVHVVDTYPGKTDQGVGLAEVKLRSTNFEGL